MNLLVALLIIAAILTSVFTIVVLRFVVEGREYDRVARDGANRIDTLSGTSSVNNRGGNGSRCHTRELTEIEGIVDGVRCRTSGWSGRAASKPPKDQVLCAPLNRSVMRSRWSWRSL